MMKQWKNKCLMFMLCIAALTAVNAQAFNYHGSLVPVQQTGFYSIRISPEISAHTKLDFSDLRIWDEKERQVPYIIRSRKTKWESSLFKPFVVTENRLDDSGRSVIVVQKDVSYPIPSLSLIIKNAAVSRYAILSGSNDGKKWFIISEKILVNDRYDLLADSSIQSVSFPSSSYTFFRLMIDNKKTDPLNIISIGYYPSLEYRTKNPFTTNVKIPVEQKDSSDGFSYIKVVQPLAYQVSRLSIDISGPKYYSRKVSLLFPDIDKRKRHFLNEWANFTATAEQKTETNIPAFKAKEFYLRIENGDNPPLQIQTVTTMQDYHEIVAWLEAGKKYEIVMDAANALTPHYDLQQFSDSIPASLPEVLVENLKPISNQKGVESDSFPRKYIWLIMAGVVAVLGCLTWKMTMEMRKGNQ